MTGHVHNIRLYGLRQTLGASPTMEPVRDSEGRFVQSPTNPPSSKTLIRELVGFVGYPKRDEVPEGENIDNAAHLPRGTVVNPGDELEAVDIPEPDGHLNGRYEIVGVTHGPALVRVLLRRFT